MSAKRPLRRRAVGIVERGPKDKTIAVVSVRRVRHPKYGKYLRRTTRYHVHDEKHEARPGDRVEIMETRPLSKTKHWRLVRVLSRRAGAAQDETAS